VCRNGLSIHSFRDYSAYSKIVAARNNKVDQHLSIRHELVDATVDFSITAVTGFHLRQFARRIYTHMQYKIKDNSI